MFRRGRDEVVMLRATSEQSLDIEEEEQEEEEEEEEEEVCSIFINCLKASDGVKWAKNTLGV